MASTSTAEPPPEEVEAAQQKVIELAQEKSGILSNSDLMESFPDMAPAVRVAVINRMLQQGLVELLKKGNQLAYRLVDPTKKTTAPKGADNEEKIVYSIIEEGGNKGIWIRDIRVKSNLIMTQLNKILKSLENKKLIKAVKSVNASKKKVYMLYNLDPDRSVTGGSWYQDQDFESEFVDVLNQQCLRYLQMRTESAAQGKDGPLLAKQKSLCSVSDVHTFIKDLGISKVNLDEEDLETILKTVVYDGKAERVVQMDGSSLYRAIIPALPPPGLVQMPCGICPVISSCSTYGLVTPKTCQYMSEWLN
ncbi:probable DNA-directed RNA polymerase III subunit RPC6 [Lutzomyia longipalpis]|nr:probable DNA-directed RNA polymerase III subunit RPC6 [Lutzomyia longipalpis]XP_055677858.1 probable DNA-directed RNA polymerase III subunit RPC6 [Lutzomyia longipalpis]XP_055677859.1 probable DNA-directed RNA polymerase III subunit RPC6 [Lutzomyia longipalpis]